MPDHPSLFSPPLHSQPRPPHPERFDQYEVQREVAALLDGLLESERRQVIAAIGERYRLTISDLSTAPKRGYHSGYNRKRRP